VGLADVVLGPQFDEQMFENYVGILVAQFVACRTMVLDSNVLYEYTSFRVSWYRRFDDFFVFETHDFGFLALDGMGGFCFLFNL